ncbi:hypothetical protein LPJ53_005361 [Coemansia erecta]|uniref:Small ribosomal subunit protein bS18m n=1 Tax=Coemansia erecta TaxID=147472 RepID=A0A9W7XWW7_9FUNG|nr:hypothetical protein LPJ53_005361 [Coemansia erecta]
MLSTLSTRISSLRSATFGAVCRTMSTTPNNGPDSASSPPSSSERKRQMERIMAPMIRQQQDSSQTPEKIFENSAYTHMFFPKQTYTPRDLNEMTVLKNTRKPEVVSSANDPFVALGINPLDYFKNSLVLGTFVTDMGKIKPRYKTGLTAKSQRRLAKAIKRARSFGLMPVTSKPYHMYNYKSLSRGGTGR